MSDTEINTAMAKLHGWTWILESGPADYMALRNPLGGLVDTNTDLTADFPSHLVPDYANDQNAMHEALQLLHGHASFAMTFAMHLLLINGQYINSEDADLNCDHAWICAASTARQRATALLRVFGKWKEGK